MTCEFSKPIKRGIDGNGRPPVRPFEIERITPKPEKLDRRRRARKPPPPQRRKNPK